MKRAVFITVGIIVVFLVVLFLIFMSMRAKETESVTGSIAPDGTVFEIPTEPPPGALRNEAPQSEPQPESTDGGALPTLE